MPSNLPSIADLLKQRTSGQTAPVLPTPATVPTPEQVVTPAPEPPPIAPTPEPSPHSRIKLADKDVASALSEKMQNISTREKEDEAARKGSSLGFPSINLKGFPISPEALSLLPEERARDLAAVAFLFTGPELRIGAVNPDDPRLKELLFELEERHKTHGQLYIISAESLEQGMKLYAALPKIKPIVKGVQITEEELAKYAAQMSDFASIAGVLTHANVTDVLTVIIAAAIKLNTSDVHIEAEETGIVVRFRVDGMLQEVTKLDREQWKRIIGRIKLIASLKINVSDQAQDGRFTIKMPENDIDVRVSTMPMVYGESVVMRLLTQSMEGLELDNLGLRDSAYATLKREIERPNGMIITTGPTGSGKTTVLYAFVREIATSENKVVTLEDPIEYHLPQITQTQIEPEKGYDFAKGLRAILRQDPDVVLVGEIRDKETAEIAVHAALTGHLLFSTLHTNDAAGAVPRLVDMGINAAILSSALSDILAQRLVRRLCEKCREKITAQDNDQEFIDQVIASMPEKLKQGRQKKNYEIFRAKGCPACGQTGYKGRVGIFEILRVDDEMEKLIAKSPSHAEIKEAMLKNGDATMLHDGVIKVLEGLTSVEEIRSAVGEE